MVLSEALNPNRWRCTSRGRFPINGFTTKELAPNFWHSGLSIIYDAGA